MSKFLCRAASVLRIALNGPTKSTTGSLQLPHVGGTITWTFTPCVSQLGIPAITFTQQLGIHTSCCRPTPLQQHSLKNRPTVTLRKKPSRLTSSGDHDTAAPAPGTFNVYAYSTSDEYDLEALVQGLRAEDLYEPRRVTESNPDVVHARAKYQVDNEPRDIFFLREGSVVLWNVSELEASNVLRFLRPFERHRYSDQCIQAESEAMGYTLLPSHSTTDEAVTDVNASADAIQSDLEASTINTNNPRTTARRHIDSSLDSARGVFRIPAAENALEKYACSNAMALSVKLGVWEAALERYIDSIEGVTGDLKQGARIRMTQEEVLRKHGELFVLRHVLNLSSDMLDTPDFYWDREQLEKLYLQTSGYFSISRRTKVMNEKISHCIELIELLSSHLSDKHHVRLEWMIIVLIMVEVGFEVIHYIDRYLV